MNSCIQHQLSTDAAKVPRLLIYILAALLFKTFLLFNSKYLPIHILAESS